MSKSSVSCGKFETGHSPPRAAEQKQQATQIIQTLKLKAFKLYLKNHPCIHIS